MDLTREAIDRITELSEPKTINLNGLKYTTRPVHRVNDPVAEPLRGWSLEAVIDYLAKNLDKITECLVEVSSQHVCVTSPLNDDRRRDIYFVSEPKVPRIIFNQNVDVEKMKIMLMSQFVQDDQSAVLLSFLASLCEKSGTELRDDGVSQSIAVNTGIANLENITVPNPIILRPFRTFYDIEQPASTFVFRMAKGLQCALYEADGGAWVEDEVEEIKDFLFSNIKDISGINICLLG